MGGVVQHSCAGIQRIEGNGSIGSLNEQMKQLENKYGRVNTIIIEGNNGSTQDIVLARKFTTCLCAWRQSLTLSIYKKN